MMDEPATFEAEQRLGRHALAVWLVAGYLMLFLIRPWEVLLPALADLRIERIYGLIMVGIVLLTGRRIVWDLTSIGVALFAGAAVLSASQAWKVELAGPAIYQYLTVVATYFLMRSVCKRPEDLYLLIVTYLATMTVYLGKSLWEYCVHGRHWYAQGVSRMIGIEQTYGEPNALAMSVVLSLPGWLFAFRCRKELYSMATGWWSLALRGVIFGYPLLAVLSVGLTNSRAGMAGLVAFVVAAIWWGAGQGQLSRKTLLTFGLIVGMYFMVPDEQWDRLRTLWRPDLGPSNARASADGRWAGFLAGWRMFQDHPLTGVGMGNFLSYRVTFIDGVGLIAHNLPGQLLGETGLLGVGSFALLVLAMWQDTRRTRYLATGLASLRLYEQIAVACQLTILLSFLFGFSLHNGFRFNWLWVAAFGSLANGFCRDVHEYAWFVSESNGFDEDADVVVAEQAI